MDSNEEILVISALLHDIGKLVQRASENPKEKKHEEFGAEFLSNPKTLNIGDDLKREIINIVKSHHQIKYNGARRNLLEIVKKADRASAAHERDKSEGVDEKINKTPLLSVFSYIDIGIPKSPKRYYHISMLNSKNLVYPDEEPKSKNDRFAYARIKKSLEMDLENLSIQRKEDVNTLLYILQKHLRYIPSAVYINVPDIPLYDHLKTTAAIALCLHRSTGDKKYTLIMGDLSGIQNFIFSSFKGGESQAVDEHGTKRMRGRSLTVNLIIDSVARYILEQLDLYEFNILWQSGGNFLILAPTEENMDNKIKEISKNVNSFLLEEFGNLYLNIAWNSYDSLDNFSGVLEDIHRKMNDVKSTKFLDFMRDESFYLSATHSKFICPSCGIHPVNSEDEVCDVCRSMEELGSKIVKSKYLIRKLGNGGDFTFRYGNVSIAYTLTEVPSEDGEVFSLDSFDIPSTGALRGFKILKNHVPQSGGVVLSISDMVEVNGNKSKIGIFKADVDCLGEIFARGLKGEQKDRVSISRVTMLSFLMDLFFTVEVNNIVEKNNVYVVFSGGDDLTALGRYDNIVSFATDIVGALKKWSGENPNIHISGGIVFFNEKFPVRRAVEIAEDYLHSAKNPEKEIKRCVERGDQVSIFDFSLSWEDFEEQIHIANMLFNAQKAGKVPASFSHYLLKLYELSPETYATRPLKKGDIFIPSPLPYLKYYFGRRNKDEALIEKLSQNRIYRYIPVGVSLWVMDRKYKKEVM